MNDLASLDPAFHTLPSKSMQKCNTSMHLTRAADYAVRAMVHLAALSDGERIMLPNLSVQIGAPESFLSKVLQALARAQFISSRRGKAGGFAILPAGRHATMRAVIEAIDGPVCLNICLDGDKDCERKSWCPAHPVWARAQRALLDVLMSATVSAMASQSARRPGVSTSPEGPAVSA